MNDLHKPTYLDAKMELGTQVQFHHTLARCYVFIAALLLLWWFFILLTELTNYGKINRQTH